MRKKISKIIIHRVSVCKRSIQSYDTSNELDDNFTNEYVFNHPIPSSVDENTLVSMYIKQCNKIQCPNINFENIATKQFFRVTYCVINKILIPFPREHG